MSQISKIEFKTVIIDGTECYLNILTYSKENYSLYFSMQSVAQSINELILIYGPKDVFHREFYDKWHELQLKCFTEFQLQLLVPINLMIEPDADIFSPMPFSVSSMPYLNDRYQRFVTNYADHTSSDNDIFCIAERQRFTTGPDHRHNFMNSIGFLSLISVLRLKFLQKLYKTFFQLDMMNSDDIEYIYDTLVLNRAQTQTTANVFQLDEDNAALTFQPVDMNSDSKHIYVSRFNRACRIFKAFAFNIMDEQSVYIAKNLQIVTQFGMNRAVMEADFKRIPKFIQDEDLTDKQVELLCRQPDRNHISVVELHILQAIIRIHLMIQKMTNVKIQKEDLVAYRHILKTKFSTDLDDLLYECPGDPADDFTSYEVIDGKNCIVKNYTIGEIIGAFIQLYEFAQASPNTIWLCKFLKLACNTRYSNLVNIMADFVPLFQRFFTNDFNVNSINNLIIFLQGMCKPDIPKIASLNRLKDIQKLDVRNFKTFALTKYLPDNSNPLLNFIDLILTSKQHQQQQLIINPNTLSDTERHSLLTLQDPREQQFIDYIYELETAPDTHTDLSGNNRFNLLEIDYAHIVPAVSTNTFNENNLTHTAKQLFNGIIDQALFFHELSNRTLYKIPGVVCNVNIK